VNLVISCCVKFTFIEICINVFKKLTSLKLTAMENAELQTVNNKIIKMINIHYYSISC